MSGSSPGAVSTASNSSSRSSVLIRAIVGIVASSRLGGVPLPHGESRWPIITADRFGSFSRCALPACVCRVCQVLNDFSCFTSASASSASSLAVLPANVSRSSFGSAFRCASPRPVNPFMSHDGWNKDSCFRFLNCVKCR